MKFVTLCLVLSSLAIAGDVDPKHAKNLTFYHVNEPNYTGISNMDTGDARGDALFSLRSIYLPIECSDTTTKHFSGDCANPEVVGDKLTVTEVVVEVDSRFGNYSECNVCTNSTVPFTRNQTCTDGDYICVCGSFYNLTTDCPPTVGVESPSEVFEKFPMPKHAKNYNWWLINLAERIDGKWYSMPAAGQCDDSAKPCTWRLVESKRRVLKSCQDEYIFDQINKINPTCFSTCPQPKNSTSTCFIECFYSTLLGVNSDKGKSTGGLSQEQISDMWKFPVVNDERKGGCPEYKP